MKENTRNSILEIQENINKAKNHGLTIMLVEADTKKGFNYPYILCYPHKNMKNTLVMNCLNDYEEAMLEDETENLEAIEQIYSLFGESRILSDSKLEINDKKQEDKEKSLDRLSYRIQRATNSFHSLVTNFNSAPIMMPLIPGFKTAEKHENTASELATGLAKELAPQILAMIENARNITNSRTGIELDDKIISFGHSKESTFAERFSVLYPEKVKAAVLGGTEYATLPIEEIRLIIDNNKSEQFEIRDGIPYKKITSSELSEIMQEYREYKKEHQNTISLNDDGSYSLPMNYPLGIADIEQYKGEFSPTRTKNEYLKHFTEIPRMIFVGEDEDKIDGHYAYLSGKTLDGKEIAMGEDLSPFEDEEKRPLFEIEHASMHNRVLDYVLVQRILFGKSNNERLNQYVDLCNKLGINMQSKIYTKVGHRDIYRSTALTNDLNKVYSNLIEHGNLPELDDNERAPRISPIYQLVRRFTVANSESEHKYKKQKFNKFIQENKAKDKSTEYKNTIGVLQKAVDDYVTQVYHAETPEANMDKIYDNLKTNELEEIFNRVASINKKQNNKTIPMQSIIVNAIKAGIGVEDVTTYNNIRYWEDQRKSKEGVTKDD